MNKFCKGSQGCQECTKRSPVFNQLDEDDLRELNQNRFEVVYQPGEILFKQGSGMSHLLSLTSGYIALAIELDSTKRQIFKISSPFDLIGGLGLFSDKRHHYTAFAISEVSVCYLDTANFQTVFNRNSLLANNFMKQLADRQKLLLDLIQSLNAKSLQHRIADAIKQLQLIVHPIDTLLFDAKIIAAMANGAKDNVVRTLKEWEAKGLIELVHNQLKVIKSLPASEK